MSTCCVRGSWGAAAAVAPVVLDVDGVLTDGRLWFGPDGEALKVLHVRDGHGIRSDRGRRVAVISGRRSPAVTERMRELASPMSHKASPTRPVR
jgi:YrbI family 3-deoxy-D-manno-octulosonate 8-phosphate phosphatase